MDSDNKKLFDNISYLEDDNRVINVFVDILEMTDSYVKFKTIHGTIIIVPLHRVLKIKKREDLS